MAKHSQLIKITGIKNKSREEQFKLHCASSTHEEIITDCNLYFSQYSVIHCVGIFTEYVYPYKRIYIINPNCLYINIYMAFTLILYIYINLPNFVNVPNLILYIYINLPNFVINLFLHVFLHVCNVCKVVEKNRCPSLHVLTDTRQPLLTAKARSDIRVAYIIYNTGLACTLVYPEGDDTLYTFCQCITYMFIILLFLKILFNSSHCILY